MAKIVQSNRNLWIHALLSGCAFGILYLWTVEEYGWKLHLGFELLASFMMGTILQYLPLSPRNKIFVLTALFIGGVVQNIDYVPVSLWIGFNFGVILSSERRQQTTVSTLILFPLSLGLSLLIPVWFIPPLILCFAVSVFQTLHLSPVPVRPSSDYEFIPALIHGALSGMLYIALWNQQAPLTHPQPNHLLLSVICVFGCAGISSFAANALQFDGKRLHGVGGWSVVLLWPILGFASVQDWSGDTMLIGSMVVSGLLGIFLHPSKAAWVGMGISLFLSKLLTDQITEFPVITLLAMFWMIFEGFKTTTVLTAAICSFCLFTNRGPVHQSIPISKYITVLEENKYIVTQKTWSNSGWIFFGQKIQMSKDVTIPLKNELFVESLPITKSSRRWTNEANYGTLLKNLLPDVGQIAILNDISGQVNISLGEASNLQVNIFTPNTLLTRMVAQTYPERKNAWLKPNRLLQENSGYYLGRSSQYDLIVESIHHPWSSSISNGFSHRHLEHLEASLNQDGIAAFIVHLQEVPNTGFGVFAKRLESIFEHTLYVLPKDNIDALLVLCSKSPMPYSKFKEKLSSDTNNWINQIILNSYPLSANDNVDLSPQNRPSIPFAHLTSLKDKLPDPSSLWSDLPSQDIPKIKEAFNNHREYLELISAGMSGTLQGIQQTNLPFDLKQNLIAPHLQSAKKHIRLAQAEGQSSTEWGEAQRYALTAQLIAPNNIEPWLLLGDIAIGEGFIDKAEEKYLKAQELDPTSVEAINGLARVAGLQENTNKVESLLIEAQQLEPGNWIPTYNLATFLLQQERIDEAQKLFQTTLDLPNGDNTKSRIGLIECFIAQEKWTRGLLEVDRLIQMSSTPSATLWFLRGRIHFGLQIWDKAEVDFRKATLEDPQFHAARGSIGLIKIAQGDLEGAAQAFRSTLRFDPNNEVARKNLQQVLQQLNTVATPE